MAPSWALEGLWGGGGSLGCVNRESCAQAPKGVAYASFDTPKKQLLSKAWQACQQWAWTALGGRKNSLRGGGGGALEPLFQTPPSLRAPVTGPHKGGRGGGGPEVPQHIWLKMISEMR